MRAVGPALASLRGGLTVLLLVRTPVLVLLGHPAVPLAPALPLTELAMTLGLLPVLGTRLWSLLQPSLLVGLLLASLVVLSTLMVLLLSLPMVLALLLVGLLLDLLVGLVVVLWLLVVLMLPSLALLLTLLGVNLLERLLLWFRLPLLRSLFGLELSGATVLSLLCMVGPFVTPLGRLLTDPCEAAILPTLVERLPVLLLGLLVAERLALLLWSVRSVPALLVGLLWVVLMHSGLGRRWSVHLERPRESDGSRPVSYVCLTISAMPGSGDRAIAPGGRPTFRATRPPVRVAIRSATSAICSVREPTLPESR